MTYSALTPGSVAVITGGASGIGLAAASRFARVGLQVCIADLDTERLDRCLRPNDVLNTWEPRFLASPCVTAEYRRDALDPMQP